ncbi:MULTISPECIES: DUF948 domain-containing protein [Paenibacillus]|uniref:DUF948 domain-containing protein n=1 Tax=Paenibacillus campinasensis TaxID=66347 RepID=A0A268EMU0_9BACL|nr:MULTISPECIES: DUF948 domain-containing protein [Paenibacillus]MUG66975.1 DUF948 domain-containing protein [Paenibacillus campinasensis]PAD74436.1 hypothetical protein CHH67_17970 [Paenibacillus campinasensis]PAK50834.1 hypothetical protein CHH75_16515 [Paenibacillus sp. 7541]
MLTQISVAVIAVAFAVLVFFLIRTLKAATQSLDKVTQTLQDVQKTVDELSYEVKQTIRNTNDIAVDIQHKMQQINPVMDTVKNLGEALSEVSYAVKQVSAGMVSRFKHKPAEPQQEAVRERSLPEPGTKQDRTIQSYESVYEASRETTKGRNWLSYVDMAVGLWNSFRRQRAR